MTNKVAFTTFNQLHTNSDTFWRENCTVYTSLHKPSIHPHCIRYPYFAMTVNQTVTKSYVCEQMDLLYWRHFTGHPAATVTNEVTFTTFSRMEANSGALSGEKLLYTRHFISFPYFAMTSEVTYTTFNQMDTNSHTFSRETCPLYTSLH